MNSKILFFTFLITSFLVFGCSDNFDKIPILDIKPIELTKIQKQDLKRQDLKAFKIYFNDKDFYGLNNPNAAKCAGDAKVFRNPYQSDIFGIALPFEQSLRNQNETVKPAFVRNISVDLTNVNEQASNAYVYPAHECSIKGQNEPPTRACAFMDSNADKVLPGQIVRGIGSRFYTFEHLNCEGVGPVVNQSYDYAGGIDIDLDRTFIGENEEILFQLTYFPMSRRNNRVLTGSKGPPNRSEGELSKLSIHLINIEDFTSSIQSAHQPRYFNYFESSRYPKIAKTYSALSTPRGYPIEKQFVISSAMSTKFNRIRIERIQGSAILVSAAIFLMGQR